MEKQKSPGLFDILISSLGDMFRPGILLFLILPPVLFILCGLAAGVYFWGPMNDVLFDFVSRTFLSQWISVQLITGFLAFFAMALILFPTLFMLTTIFFSALLVPRLVRVLQREAFQQVVLQPQSLNFSNLWITIKLSFVYMFLLVLTFPINILLPPLGLVINWWGLGYFNSKLFSREILAEILPPAEAEAFFKQPQNRSALTSMGLVTAFLYFIPVINFLAPTWTALALTRLCLQRMSR